MANIGQVIIRQPTQTRMSIVDPSIAPTLAVTLNDLTDVNTANVANGYTLVYNSNTNSYEMKPLELSNLGIASIEGGTF